MNVVARRSASVSNPRLAGRVGGGRARGHPPATIHRRCLRVGSDYGFIFGNGLLTNFLEEYYARGSYGAGGRVDHFSHPDFPAHHGPLRPAHLPPFPRPGAGRRKSAAANPAHGHWARPRFPKSAFASNSITAPTTIPTAWAGWPSTAAPLSLLLDVLDVRLGRGLSPKRATSFVATRLSIEPEEPESAYTLDGDLYVSHGPLTVEVGPRWKSSSQGTADEHISYC
jgi:hypothetical protein